MDWQTPSSDSDADFTGRYLVLLDSDHLQAGIQQLANVAQMTTVASTDEIQQSPDRFEQTDIIVLENLGVAIINHSIAAEQIQDLAAAVDDSANPILLVEPEQYFYALMDEGESVISQPLLDIESISLQYLTGYRDGVSSLVDRFVKQDTSTLATSSIIWKDTNSATWGLQATKVLTSPYSGKGIKIAVLDTGFDLNHPDYSGRTIVSKSFVLRNKALLPVQDLNGHGTHCVGTACGSLNPKSSKRYGVAYGADIYVAKVLDDRGVPARGLPGEILQGIDWAISQGCHVVSMSLGSLRSPGSVQTFYHKVMDRALNAGTLVIAAAGNSRQDKTGKQVVNTPADAPSAMAVAAITANEQVASFSSYSDTVAGGQIDIAAPGTGIYSSYITKTQSGSTTSGYTVMQGTSMATPHVAGIAALYAEKTGKRGNDLWTLLTQNARRLPLLSTDIGAGLVQAPQ